ncbi:MAG: LptF/LptG family permease [bacterium]|nr:LptF/LptG family permease [bacterium]
MILHRYVLKEHLAPFLFSFSVIMFLLMVDLILQMLDRILGKGIPVMAVLELFVLSTAWMVALAVPMSVLVSTLMAFGRLSSDREIVAMRALGIGLWRVVLPVLFAGGVVGVVLLIFNDRVLPEFNHRARVLMMDIHRKKPAIAFEGKEGLFIEDFQNIRILFGQSDPITGMLKDVLVYKYDAGKYPMIIVADSGTVRFSGAKDEAYLMVYSGELHQVDEEDPQVYMRAWFDTSQVRLGDAGRQLSRSVSQYRNDREMGIGMMLGRIEQYERELGRMEAQSASYLRAFFYSALLDSTSDDAPLQARELRSVMGRLNADDRLLAHKRRAADRLWVEVHKKFTISFACVVFILVGAPLGVQVRGSGPAVGAGISIGFFLLWWVCLIGGEKLADRGFVPAWLAMWSPNILLGFLGAFLFCNMVLEQMPWRRKRCAS